MYDDEMDTDEGRAEEAAANLQCEMIDAARALMEEHDWTAEDVLANLGAAIKS